MDEIGWRGDDGVVGEFGSYQGVKYLVDYGRRVEGLPRAGEGVEAHPDVDLTVGPFEVVSSAVLLSRGKYTVN